jgi:transcription antitermination factor NusG
VDWYVIYTKSRSEKKVAERLSGLGYEVYCPLRKEIRVWSDRKKSVEIPIFSSYVFIQIEEHQRYTVLEVPGVVNFIYWLGKPAVVRPNEIDDIRAFLDSYENVKSRGIDFHTGDSVKVSFGQLKDKSGVVTEVRSQTVVLQLEGIGFELFAEIDGRYIEKAALKY